MMGGASQGPAAKHSPEKNADLISAVNASSSEHDPASLTHGGATGPFKLPNITRGSGFSQSGHDVSEFNEFVLLTNMLFK